MQEPSDEHLMRAVSNGDVEQLGVLFARHHARVHALCFRLTRRADVADDLVQETMLRVLRFRQSFREQSAFATWLFRLAYNACCDHWRSSRRDSEMVGLDDFAMHASTGNPPATDPTSDRHILLDLALTRLDADERSVLVLRRYHDMSYSDIARVLECTPAAARVRAHRALSALRDSYCELERQHGLR